MFFRIEGLSREILKRPLQIDDVGGVSGTWMISAGVIGMFSTVSIGVVEIGALSSSAVCSGTACTPLAEKNNAYKKLMKGKALRKHKPMQTINKSNTNY